MSSLPFWSPSDAASADIHVTYFIRQNPWRSKTNLLPTIISVKRIHAPHGHTHADVVGFQISPYTYLSTAASPVKTFLSIPTGSHAIIPMSDNESSGLLVRITGDAEAGAFPGLIATHMGRECRHDRYTHDCDQCKASHTTCVESTLPPRPGHWTEPFWAIHRTVEVLGKLDTAGHDMRKLATVSSIGALTSWWKQNS